MLGISQIEEDVPLPDWPIRWETAKNGYSPLLIVEAPDDARIEQLLPVTSREA